MKEHAPTPSTEEPNDLELAPPPTEDQKNEEVTHVEALKAQGLSHDEAVERAESILGD